MWGGKNGERNELRLLTRRCRPTAAVLPPARRGWAAAWHPCFSFVSSKDLRGLFAYTGMLHTLGCCMHAGNWMLHVRLRSLHWEHEAAVCPGWRSSALLVMTHVGPLSAMQASLCSTWQPSWRPAFMQQATAGCVCGLRSRRWRHQHRMCQQHALVATVLH